MFAGSLGEGCFPSFQFLDKDVRKMIKLYWDGQCTCNSFNAIL